MKKILLVLLLIPTLNFAQHTISGTFTPADEFSWCILYKVNSDSFRYVVDGKVTDGKFSLTLDSTVTKGVYKLVYGIPQEELNFDVIYNGEEDIELTFSKGKRLSFTAPEENKVFQEYLFNKFLLDQEISDAYASEPVDETKIMELFARKTQLQNTAEEALKGTYSESFIVASRTYIPSAFESKESYEENRRQTYFKFLDPNNPVLQNSSFVLNRFMKYIGTFSLETEIASYRELDAIINLVQNSDQTFQKNILYQLWGKLVLQEMPRSANYLTEKYLLQLCNTLGETEIVSKLENYRRTSIGIKVPDFSWEVENNGKIKMQHLYEYDVAENYILVFWSSTCSHCLKELPKLQKFVNTLDQKKYKVIAVGIEDNKFDWKNETLRYPEFQHVLGLGKWENTIAKSFSISQTPTFFLLDENKILTAKPSGLSELVEMIAQ
ncbi:TlpA disulfide reductase family protein [Aureisphaera galaxeae]|uniref:TlpA family protein disulfide reductase n=1 Tax=Aureisphaera galaxeae TaxID=1538023 RepID=UPI00234FD71E|nr:TlpA disulfide reductase family protein [Aureisphaera galaxeae]MDC8006018.1 TlpA disulfide reductase family protein [Aureisphaera galaxeae]